MKKIYAMAALLWLSVAGVSAQTMSISIEGKEVKNGDNVVVTKLAKEAAVGPFTMYDLGVDVVFRTNVAQTVSTEGVDLDKVTPGLACCPPGFTCTTANADNGWTSTGTMTGLEAGREVKGEWIHYNYQRTQPEMGTERSAVITFRGATETISFNLIIKVGEPSAIEQAAADADLKANTYNVAGQRVGQTAKGLLIRNGKKYMKR